MSLKSVIASLKGGRVLLPVLQDFIVKRNHWERSGRKSRKNIESHEARLTIQAMRMRIREFNHGEEIEGEKFHPSRLGSCMRQTWFKEKHAPRDERPNKRDDLKSYFTFAIGSSFHVIFTNLIIQSGILEEREVPINSYKYKILGHCDAIVRIDDVRYGVEIKTINQFDFKRIALQPLHSHKVQALAYMKPLGLQWMIFIYFNKATEELKEHVMQFDEKFYNLYVRARVETFFKHYRENTLPPMEDIGQNCNRCVFGDICHNKKQLNKFMATL